jgi:hypothetical protein
MQVYISHSEQDESLANTVADGLKKHGFDIWDDREILPGDNWGSKVAEGLQTSNAMVVLFTPLGLNSARIRHDIGYAIGDLNYRERLITVLKDVSLDDVPFSTRIVGKAFSLDESDDVQPIAAALRMAA